MDKHTLEQRAAKIPAKTGDTPPTAPTFYPIAESRFVASIVVGYGPADTVTTPREAACSAMVLVKEGGTIWTVLDRETSEVTMWEDLGEGPEPVTEARALAARLGDAGKLDEGEADRLTELVQGFTREQVLAFVAPANPCPRCGLDPNSDDARDFGPRKDK